MALLLTLVLSRQIVLENMRCWFRKTQPKLNIFHFKEYWGSLSINQETAKGSQLKKQVKIVFLFCCSFAFCSGKFCFQPDRSSLCPQHLAFQACSSHSAFELLFTLLEIKQKLSNIKFLEIEVMRRAAAFGQVAYLAVIWSTPEK